MKRMLTLAFLFLCGGVPAHAAVGLANLQVEYSTTPLGIDVRQPRFSWQMTATAGERGRGQLPSLLPGRDCLEPAPGHLRGEQEDVDGRDAAAGRRRVPGADRACRRQDQELSAGRRRRDRQTGSSWGFLKKRLKHKAPEQQRKTEKPAGKTGCIITLTEKRISRNGLVSQLLCCSVLFKDWM